jgi:hypothetical protein
MIAFRHHSANEFAGTGANKFANTFLGTPQYKRAFQAFLAVFHAFAAVFIAALMRV